MTDPVQPDNTEPTQPATPPADATQDAKPADAPAAAPVPELTPEEKQAQERFVTLMNWLLRVNDTLDGLARGQGLEGAIMLSRRDADSFWEQTGFALGDGKLYVKVGHHGTSGQHYQPIGDVKDNKYYPSQSAKLIWARDFCVAQLHPFVGAFRLEHVKAEETDEDRTNPAYLSDKERELMIAALKELQEEMQRALAADTAEAKTEAKERLLDTVRLAAVRCVKLNDRLALEISKHPEIKSNYSGAEPMSFAGAAIDFLRMKLNDDGVRRHYKGTTLTSQESSSLDTLLGSLIEKLEAALTEPIDLTKVGNLIEATATTYPAAQAVLAPFRDTDRFTEAAAVVLGFLRLERSKLISTP